MTRTVFRFWGLGAASILILTVSNILLSLRVLRTKEEPMACGGVVNPRAWTAALQEANLTQYLSFLRKANIVTSEVRNTNKPVQCTGSTVNTTEPTEPPAPSAFHIDPFLGRWDNQLSYRTHDHVYTGPSYRSLSSKAVVSLATQTSVDRLYWLVQSARHWTEPISIAVFTPDIEFGIAKFYFQYLTTCFPFLGEKVTVHFTYPKEHPPQPLLLEITDLLELCDQPVTVLRKLLGHRTTSMMKWRDKIPYPQNLLRNVARKNCYSEWVFLVDVDIVSIPDMSKLLTEFLRKKIARDCVKCAFVIPTYEVNEKVPLPGNRSALLRLVEEKKAQPFHQKVFIFNQFATNFSLWQDYVFRPGESVTVSHQVTNFEFFYEPFYVARDSAPPHDERFIGYGFTRNTQVYEMYVAGYKFHVMNPLFTVHWGLQVKRGRPKWREKQNNVNRKLFDAFKRELYGKYQRDPLGMMKNIGKKKSIQIKH